MAGIFHKFGSHPGALVQTVLIASTPITNLNQAAITDFAATCNATSSNSIFMLQKSIDNFAVNIEELDRIEMPVGGTFMKSFLKPVLIRNNEQVRVVFSQAVAGTVSCTLNGDTLTFDIED